jgi:alpha-tubulin suppressor-like RCC1 family protein
MWPAEQEEATMVSGGEHHTIALTKSGRVYCWGRNDEGECGVGDLFGKYRREQAILEQQKLEEAEKKAKDDAELWLQLQALKNPNQPKMAQRQMQLLQSQLNNLQPAWQVGKVANQKPVRKRKSQTCLAFTTFQFQTQLHLLMAKV